MKISRLSAAVGALLAIAPGAFADLTLYDQDFEALGLMDPAALSGDNWVVFGNVFDPAGSYLYGYGTFGAPNGGSGFSAIGSGSGGAAQGLQYINVYNDYNNGDHLNGNYIEALVFQEQMVGAVDVGTTWSMSFDYLRNPQVFNGQFDSTMKAFVKVLKISDGSFIELANVEFDTTNASTATWGSMTLSLPITSTLSGELMQFGFSSYATNNNDTGVFYDNIQFSDGSNVSVGTNYCMSNPNSTGQTGVISGSGSDIAANDNFTVTGTNLPSGQFAYFIASRTQGFLANPNNSQGNLCVTGNIARFNRAGEVGAIMGGSFSRQLPLTDMPEPPAFGVSVMSGDTWNFQCWHRDFVGGLPTSNFTDGLTVLFQ